MGGKPFAGPVFGHWPQVRVHASSPCQYPLGTSHIDEPSPLVLCRLPLFWRRCFNKLANVLVGGSEVL